MLHTAPSPERLRALRRRALLTQRDVRDVTGIAQRTVSELECGRRKPQTETLRRLLSLYDINIRRWERTEVTWGTGATGDPQIKAALARTSLPQPSPGSPAQPPERAPAGSVAVWKEKSPANRSIRHSRWCAGHGRA